MTTDRTPTTHAPRSWFEIQTVGPVLIILFGLVLMFAPLASVGAAGSVGNAGAQFPKCPPTGGDGFFGRGGNAGNAGIVAPGDECPPPATAPPTTAAPTTAAPTTAPPTTSAPAPADTTPPPGPGSDEQPEVEGIVVEAPGVETEVLDAGVEAGADTTANAPAGHDIAELAFTGPEDSSLLAGGLGAVLVLGGSVLLFLSRRKAPDTC